MRVQPWLVGLFLLLASVANCTKINFRGLDPTLASFYEPKSDMFTCLDGLKTIKYQFINDDYCDCFDGSDEPGMVHLIGISKHHCAH
jgi:protein kinase C substrate 80K-H